MPGPLPTCSCSGKVNVPLIVVRLLYTIVQNDRPETIGAICTTENVREPA